MTDLEKQERGRNRMAAMRAEHGAAAEIQMAMGLTSGMLQLIEPTQLRALKLYQLIGAMSDIEWALVVRLTVEVVNDA